MSSYAEIICALAQTPVMRTIQQALNPETIVANTIAIQQIPAPTFEEAARAQVVAERFRRSGLDDVHIDAVHNVCGRWPGSDAHSPALLVSAHTDTVFPAYTDLTTRRDHNRLYGPGVGDNSLGVAALLTLLDIMHTHELHPPAPIWFVANSREEGLGDLGGIRAVWDTLRAQLGAAVVLEGMALGRIYHSGIAVRRLHITCHAPGGHSWLHFGQPSAIHGLVNLGARIIARQPPRHPRTTYNIGLISGGHSVNSLATSADLYLDLRSESAAALAQLEQQVRDDLQAVQHETLTFDVAIVGDRPAGHINPQHPLVQLAAATLEHIDYSATFETGSTDANVLLANGLPTVTVGITHGGQAHRLDEYIDIAQIGAGMWHVILLVLAAAHHLREWAS